MRPWMVGVLTVIGWTLLMRSGLGARLGSRVRAWSDGAMLAFLRLTSDFERELRSG